MKYNEEIKEVLNDTSLNGNSQYSNHECNRYTVDNKWITQRTKKREINAMHQFNKYTPLSFQNIDDENLIDCSDDDIELVKEDCIPQIVKPTKQRSNVIINRNHKKDNISYRSKKMIPGNSEYSEVASKEKKVCILSEYMQNN